MARSSWPKLHDASPPFTQWLDPARRASRLMLGAWAALAIGVGPESYGAWKLDLAGAQE